MSQIFTRRKPASDLPVSPHAGRKRALQPVTLTYINYENDRPVEEHQASSFTQDMGFIDTPGVTWLDVDSVRQVEVLESVGAYANLHPLVIEDIHDTYQRPKVEDYESYVYIVLKMISWGEADHQILAEQVSLVLGTEYVLSFKEDPGDIFDPVRVRLREGKGPIRKRGADYLAYSLIDQVVDHYFVVLESLGEQIEDLEEDLVADPDEGTLQTIHHLRRELIFLRKSVWPLREAISSLERGESPLFQPETRVYLRDVYDHTIQVMDTIDSFREMVSGMLDIYLSSVSNRMNEVMKVLTVIATIFIPLTFIAGVYGMNFVYMPELQWRWGYFAVWGLMIVIAIGMLIYFKRKGWL
jgi:magnesium transporter